MQYKTAMLVQPMGSWQQTQLWETLSPPGLSDPALFTRFEAG